MFTARVQACPACLRFVVMSIHSLDAIVDNLDEGSSGASSLLSQRSKNLKRRGWIALRGSTPIGSLTSL